MHKYRVVDCDGDGYRQFKSAESAWAEADRRNADSSCSSNPYTVVELVPVPRPVPPVPPRPWMVIAGVECEYRSGVMVSKLSKEFFNVYKGASILAAAQLIAETEAWEAAHGGKTNG